MQIDEDKQVEIPLYDTLKKSKLKKKRQRSTIMQASVGRTKAESKLENRVTELLKLQHKKIDYNKYLEENYKGQPGYMTFFKEIVSSRTLSRTLNIGKNTLGKPIKIYLLSKRMEINMFTNDYLANVINFNKNYVDNMIKEEIFPLVSLVGCFVASPSLKIEDDDFKTTEFYVTDLQPGFSAPFIDSIKTCTSVHVGEKVVLAHETVFSLKVTPNLGAKFNCYSTKNDFSPQDVASILSNMTFIKDEKGELSKGVRETERGSGNYYIQQPVRLTNCCSHTVMLTKPFLVHCLAELEIDYEKMLSRVWDDRIILDKIATFITWDTIPSFLDFCVVLYVLHAGKHDNDIFNGDDIKFYQQNRNIFNFYRSYYKLFERIMISFFDSFSTRIPIDKLMKLRKYIQEFNNYREAIIGNAEKITKMTALLAKLNSTYINNFITLDPNKYIQTISNYTSKILNPDPNSPESSENLTSDARALGFMIKELMYDGTTPIFQIIRSPGSFLSNLVGNQNTEALQVKIESLLSAVDRLEQDKRASQEQIDKITKAAKQSAQEQFITQISALKKIEDLRGVIKKLSQENNFPENTLVSFNKVIQANLDELARLKEQNKQIQNQLAAAKSEALSTAANLAVVNNARTITQDFQNKQIESLQNANDTLTSQLKLTTEEAEQLKNEIIKKNIETQQLTQQLHEEQNNTENIKQITQTEINKIREEALNENINKNMVMQKMQELEKENQQLKSQIQLKLKNEHGIAASLNRTLPEIEAPKIHKQEKITKYDNVSYQPNANDAVQIGLAKQLPAFSLPVGHSAHQEGLIKQALNTFTNITDLSVFIDPNEEYYYFETETKNPYNRSPLTFIDKNINYYIPDKWGVPFIPALGWIYLANSPTVTPKQIKMLARRARMLYEFIKFTYDKFPIRAFFTQNTEGLQEAFQMVPKSIFLELLKIGQLLDIRDINKMLNSKKFVFPEAYFPMHVTVIDQQTADRLNQAREQIHTNIVKQNEELD